VLAAMPTGHDEMRSIGKLRSYSYVILLAGAIALAFGGSTGLSGRGMLQAAIAFVVPIGLVVVAVAFIPTLRLAYLDHRGNALSWIAIGVAGLVGAIVGISVGSWFR
jgi:hypothetical protein